MEKETTLEKLQAEAEVQKATIERLEAEKDNLERQAESARSERSYYINLAEEYEKRLELVPELDTMTDEQKFELFTENFQKVTLEQLEEYFKNLNK